MSFSPLDHPVCLSYPERSVSSAWTLHIPFGMLLVDLLRPALLVELGTYAGTSYCAFCQAVAELKLDTRCYAVDTWRGDGQSGFYQGDTLDDLKEHHDTRYGAFSTLLQSTFDDAVGQFSDGSIDLLHVDGYHTYDAVRHDYETWLPKMSSKGVVLFHDINERRDDFGVWQLWEELKGAYPSFEVFHGHGLGIIAVGSKIPEGLQPFLLISPDTAPRLRELLYALGVRIEAAQQTNALDEHIHFLERQSQHQIEQAIAEREALVVQLQDQARDQQELVETRARSQIESVAKRFEAMTDTLQRQLSAVSARLSVAQYELSWLNASRGVRAVRLARASRAVLTNKRPVALAGHIGAWLLGKRGYYLRDIHAAAIERAAQANRVGEVNRPDTPLVVVDEYLPPDRELIGVSIVLLAYNGLDFTRACVESLYRVECHAPFEVIVVDNGSGPDLKAWLKEEAGRRESLYYVSLMENIGFPRGMNVGIVRARGQHVVLLNNDTVVTSGWLDQMIVVAESDPSIGIISPMTNYVGHGPQKDPLAAFLAPQDAEAYALTLARTKPVQYVPDRLVFFTVMIERPVIDALGALDEGFGKGNYEDDDYCAQARMAGFKLAIAKRAFVYHNPGSRTWNSSPDLNYTLMMEHNKMRFLGKLSDLSMTLSPTAIRNRHTETPEVSVVVRTVNRPETLKIALTSLANQTFESFEVVIVNDAGPDLSALLEPFRQYLTIREVRHTTSQGRTSALNSGITHSRGKWVAFLDDDDIAYPLHLEMLWDTAQSAGANCAFVYSDYMRTLMAGAAPEFTTIARRPLGTWEYNRDELLVHNRIPIHCWLVRRDEAEETGLFDTSMDMLEDWDFLIRLGLRHTFYPTRRISCEYRFYLNASNSLAWDRQNSLEGMIAIYDRYPAPSPERRKERETEILGLRQQAVETDRIKRLKDIGKITPDEAAREVMALVADLRA